LKCPDCGSQNAPGAKTCHSCGKDIRTTPSSGVSEELNQRVSRILDRMPPSGRIDPRDVAQRLRLDYSSMHREPTARTVEAMCALMNYFHKPQIDTRKMMEEAAAQIQKLFSVREVGIGLKSPTDGIYRYEVLLGHRPDAEAATRRIQYTEADLWDDKKYKSTIISKLTRLFLAEDSPYTNNEKDSYSRPFMLQSKRTSLDESVEGDYIDVIIPGLGGETLGWIEISGTRIGKLPDPMAIRWIEALATMIGTAIVCNDVRRIMARDSAKKPVL